MAWPPLSSRSEPSSCSTHWRSDQRRHRRKKHSSSPSSVLSPSSTLLSFLASLVSATTAHASPPPPTFLCPSIGSDATTPPCHDKRDPPLGKFDRQQESGRSKLRRVPDRFVEGGDGIWRRVESYTLYGVTAPNPSCDDESCPPPRPKASIGVGFPLNGTALTPLPVDLQLPPGWKAAPKATNNRTTTILAVSLALSLFICFLIIICLFWRKGLFHKKKRSQDVEARGRPNRHENFTSEEHRNIEVEKEAKALQKIWARASARWKANARYSLRQRRGKRFLTRSHSHHQPTTSTVGDSRSHLASRPPSIQSSPITNDNREPLDERLPNQESQNPTSRPSSPPAYNTDNQIPPIIISPPQQTPGSAPSHLSRRLSQPSLYSSNAHPHMPDLGLFPAAHVATDDKTLLARLADLASAPPDETDSVANMSLTQVSAPEDLDIGDPIQIDRPPSISLLPPPPSKERLAAAERLEYTFAYDNLENTEPEPEPSAPPFEESSAMPPLDDSMLFPSAPPIIDGEENRFSCPSTTCLPGAPPLEVMSYEGNNVPSQYHEQAMTKTQ